MKLKEFGRSGVRVSEIGMGTYYDPLWIASAFLGWRRGAATKLNALNAGFDQGITLVDTAEIYKSEGIVSKAVKGRKRDDLFIATKVWSNHLRRDDLVKAFEGSLRRLGTSYVDLYQVHWPNPRVPIAETMAAMDSLVRAGKLRGIGVSNFSLEQIEEANSSLPKSQLSSVQLSYSLLHRAVERDILPYCSRNGLSFLAYYPLGHGKLSSGPGLDSVAKRNGMSKAQVALRWLADKSEVFPIPRASRREHVLENVKSSREPFSIEDSKEIEGVFPPMA